MDSPSQLLNSDLTGGSLLKLTPFFFFVKVLEWQTDKDSDEGVKENILSFSRGALISLP